MIHRFILPAGCNISAVALEFSDDTLGKLAELDDEFMAYPHNLTDLLFSYVSQHPEEFGMTPEPD
jgi:hypothetical protein